ncbi:uncharacterized protein N7446_003586 [Penicillium canescens]|uniref:uncharacterized protein n=1 Tax=Penicillium canescens TaxID=5083 RepID=UPI0026E0DF91|nr:uncharacterized protein N7446_003586 [Penicillium canescens]KAJ6066549.1 hypothetical protein N7446_003586 [Penicillium canescens]KAJ6174106.1 hypothetical protein N7485_006918 [Penicillium canescens]
MTKPKLLRGVTPKAWFSKLRDLAAHQDVPAFLRDHINEVSPPELPHVNPSDTSVHDTSLAFGLKEIEGYVLLQLPDVQVHQTTFCST